VTSAERRFPRTRESAHRPRLAFSRNSSLGQMYRRETRRDRWRVVLAMERSEDPFNPACVAMPARTLWPAMLVASRPAVAAVFLRIAAIESPRWLRGS
jgi:hypothetical protein